MKKSPLTKEYLIDRFVNKKWSYCQIYKETGWSKSTIRIKIQEFGLARKRTLKGLNLIGERFTKLTVISISTIKKNNCNHWNCKCDCGKEIVVSTGNLLSGNSPSCGCIRQSRRGKLSPSWQGKGELGKRYWSILQNNSEKRGIYFNITIDDMWELYEKQNGCCMLTGLKISIKHDNQTASLDRIDSSKGYIVGNIQWVHKDINKMKNILDNNIFIEYCKLVAKNNI